MNVFELTRALVDIESITNNEERVALYLRDYLAPLAARYGGAIETIEVEPRRFNIFVQWGAPLIVTLSTHLDTVPPFIASREDDTYIWGRGACDTKGIIAAMIKAVEALLAAGDRGFGLLFVVGEERNSAGAYKAAQTPRGSRYIINGEPTENHLALGSKGALRYEVCATGKMAHSAYPELGDSAVNKLLDALAEIRRIPLPVDGLLGPSTLNIGTLAGGRAPNVIADEARADIMIRLVGDSTETKAALHRAAEGRADLREVIEIPAVRLAAVPGIPTTVVAYTTDIPAFGGVWGEPLLIGPGTIHVAHTLEERVPKAQLLEAVELYQQIVKDLCKRESK
ncbi:MAG: peptidase dimerization domain protein [Candidatus Solibacter sp.]|jgi:acetylornithine deacetylase|nr:peptidase dimerization domain protein [Candidatus Solibacter sp.]